MKNLKKFGKKFNIQKNDNLTIITKKGIEIK